MPYAILRFAKMKGGPAKALEAHHERQKEKYRSNPDVDTAKSNLNYHIITPEKSYYYEIQSRIEKAGCKVRKDSIKFVDTIVTASPEFFKNRSPEKTKAYFNRAVKFLAQEIGRENIFSATVHMDEKTPHLHLCFVPLTKDNRLSAKEIIGNRPKLVEWQDKFHEYMSEAFPRLERGEPAIETQRKHIPVQLFKQATRLTAEMEGIRNLMDDMNMLNIGKKREQVLAELSKWVPKVKSFNKWIKSVQNSNQELKQEIKALKGSNDELKGRNWGNQKALAQSKYDFQRLSKEHDDMLKFCDSIPKDLRDELRGKHQQSQGKTPKRDKDLG